MTIWHEYRQATGKQRAELEEQIIRDNWKLSHYVANRIRFTHHYDYDDIHAMALIGMLDAVRTYDPDAGSKFAPYATARMMWEITNQLDADKMDKRKANSETLSIFTPDRNSETLLIIDRVDDDQDCTKKQIEDRMLIRSAFQTIRTSDRITSREREIFTMYLADLDRPKRQLAFEMGVTPQMVQGYVRRTTQKMQELMPEIKREVTV